MTPFVFITTLRGKIKLRDLLQDLNQEMNFSEIVNLFYKVLIRAATNPTTNEQRLLANIIKLHSKKQLLNVIGTDLKRLEVNFSHVKKTQLSGNELHGFGFMGPTECAKWWREQWDDLWRDKDKQKGKSEGKKKEKEDVPSNEADQLRQVEGMDFGLGSADGGVNE